MTSERPWHCQQIPNGDEPIVVCERESLKKELAAWRDGVGRALYGDDWPGDFASGASDLVPLIAELPTYRKNYQKTDEYGNEVFVYPGVAERADGGGPR